jgi:hypothetical protein
MDREKCLKCEYHRKMKAHGGWIYIACVKSPYNGAWVKNISCPKENQTTK